MTLLPKVAAHVELQIEATTLVERIRQHCTFNSEKIYTKYQLFGQSFELSYGQLWVEAQKAHGFFATCGCQTGDVVLIIHEISKPCATAFLGAMMGGFIPAFMPYPNVKQSDDVYWSSHQKLFDRIKPACIVVSEKLYDLFVQNMPHFASLIRCSKDIECADEKEPVQLKAQDIAFLQHSSGTTALKKGVMLSHSQVIEQVELYAQKIGFNQNSKIVSWLPIYHDMGLITSFIMPMICGASVIQLDAFEWVSRPYLLMDMIHQEKPHYCWLPNFAFHHLVHTVRSPEKYDLSSIQAFINCSEPCRENSMAQFEKHFSISGLKPNVCQVSYAMAENVFAVTQTEIGQPRNHLTIDPKSFDESQISFAPQDLEKAITVAACGKPLDGMRVFAVDDLKQPLNDGYIGEIAIASSTLFSGYYKQDELTQKALQNGVYYSGDMGFIHQGAVYITGRKDDMILAYGRNFMAHEFENSLLSLEGIKKGRLVVFGLPSEQLGTNELVIMAELLDGFDNEAVQKEIRACLEATAGIAPRHILFVETGTLRKSTSGKISRSANRQYFLDLMTKNT